MGELARQPGCPELAATPLELLEPRQNETLIVNEISKWAWPVIGGGLGFCSAMLRNKILYRPVWAGIHFHLLLTGGAAAAMVYIRDIRYAAKAESDEIYKHYITLHPDEFPPFERKRFRDVYQPFVPVR